MLSIELGNAPSSPLYLLPHPWDLHDLKNLKEFEILFFSSFFGVPGSHQLLPLNPRPCSVLPWLLPQLLRNTCPTQIGLLCKTVWTIIHISLTRSTSSHFHIDTRWQYHFTCPCYAWNDVNPFSCPNNFLAAIFLLKEYKTHFINKLFIHFFTIATCHLWCHIFFRYIP